MKSGAKKKKGKSKNVVSKLFNALTSCDLDGLKSALQSSVPGQISPNLDAPLAGCGSSKTPLTTACAKAFSEGVRLLLLHGADPETLDADNVSPLGAAVAVNAVACVIELLSFGSDPFKVKQEAGAAGPCASLIREACMGPDLISNARLGDVQGEMIEQRGG